jgi:hypothetical protein
VYLSENKPPVPLYRSNNFPVQQGKFWGGVSDVS